MKRHQLLVRGVALVAILGLSLAAALGSSAAATRGSAVATGPTTFTDPTGDRTGVASDITTVTVGDDYATGTITVAVTAVGFSSMSPDVAPMVKVYLNTDMNPLTGAPDQLGAEYALATDLSPDGYGWWIQRWDAASAKYVMAPQSPTMNFARTGDTVTWTINKTDISVATAMSFFVWSSTWDASDNQTGEDEAPDAGVWTYALSKAPPPPPAPAPAPAVKPVIGAPSTTPAKVVAGKRLAVVFPVTRADTGASLTKGTMVCDPSVSGKVLPHSEQFTTGKARLSFTVPRSAKGKAVKVKVTIKLGAQSTTRIATFQVK